MIRHFPGLPCSSIQINEGSNVDTHNVMQKIVCTMKKNCSSAISIAHPAIAIYLTDDVVHAGIVWYAYIHVH